MLKRRQERAKALVAALTAVFLLASLAQVLINQQLRARDDLAQRFRSRGQTGAQLISAYVQDVALREAEFASAKLADPQPSREAFDSLWASFGFEAAVLLDDQGRLLHVHPDRPELVGQNLAGQYVHLKQALAGRTSVSNVVPSAARGAPVLAVAVPYTSPHGRRVVSGAFAIGSSPLDEFVANILPYTAKVYMIDASSQIVASTVPVPDPFTPLGRQDPPLYQSFRFESAETYVSEGERHVVTIHGIPETSWSLIMAVPEARLLEPLRELRWVPWLVYSGLVLASAIALVLLVRLWRSESELRQERRKLEVQLDEAVRLNRALDEFAGRVAHDLRNPLGNALSSAQMAARHRSDPQMLEKWLETAQAQVRRGIELIQGLLELAKASGTPRREPVNLQDLVAELADEIPGIALQAGELPLLHADKLALRQALANLLDNAGRYARNNGAAKVAVKAEHKDGAWTITVEDEGPGLSPDEVASVFRPFQRGKAQGIGGTGLGLAIVATAARAHGGRAWYEARPAGGSLFKMSIPDTAEPGNGSEPAVRAEEAEISG